MVEISIICNTYNQEDYIRDALESFLMQKTNFNFEILIHDDASTDKTAEIIREYEEKYPDIVKPIYQKVNQYSQKITIVRTYQFPRVQGKYIAFCEGDDYWTDPLKLQKQYDYLEAHPEVDICAHAAISVEASTKKIIEEIAPSKESRILPFEEVIMGDGGYVAANSVLYRSEINKDIPRFRKEFGYQYTTKLHASIKGGMYYMAEIMSAYRVLAKGSWTSRMGNDINKWTSFHESKRNMYRLLDEYTEYKYTKTIQEKIEVDEFYHLIQTKQYKEAIKKENKKYFKKLPKKLRRGIWINARFSWLRKLLRKG